MHGYFNFKNVKIKNICDVVEIPKNPRNRFKIFGNSHLIFVKRKMQKLRKSIFDGSLIVNETFP